MLMQDNKSAILLQKNHLYSTGKGSKHMNVRYFFAVDKIRKKEVKMLYCPTGDMLGDFSSKPLQGSLFVKMRNMIQGVKDEDFDVHKGWYKEVLKKCGSWDDGEQDLGDA